MPCNIDEIMQHLRHSAVNARRFGAGRFGKNMMEASGVCIRYLEDGKVSSEISPVAQYLRPRTNRPSLSKPGAGSQ